jgi:hypothetical protein
VPAPETAQSTPQSVFIHFTRPFSLNPLAIQHIQNLKDDQLKHFARQAKEHCKDPADDVVSDLVVCKQLGLCKDPSEPVEYRERADPESRNASNGIPCQDKKRRAGSRLKEYQKTTAPFPSSDGCIRLETRQMAASSSGERENEVKNGRVFSLVEDSISELYKNSLA